MRELQNVIERGVITARYGRLNLDHALPPDAASQSAERSKPAHSETGTIRTIREIKQMERENLILAMQAAQWRIAGKKGAADLLGVAPSTLQSKLKALGIRRPDPKPENAEMMHAPTNVRWLRSRDSVTREIPRA